MKKGCVILLVLVLLISVISFVSAQEPLEILTPSDGAIITEQTLIEFTVTNIANEVMEFKYVVPFDDPNGNELRLSIKDRGIEISMWDTGGSGTGGPVILNPGESITKSVEFDPSRYASSYGLSGNVDIILSHYIVGGWIGILGTVNISVNIPSTSDVLVETDVGEFEYGESETEENPMSEHGRLDAKLHKASYNYQDILVIAMIIKFSSMSKANDYLNKELEADSQSFSLTEFEGSEVYRHNNHFLWLSGGRVIYVGAGLLQDLDEEISVDLAELYLEKYPSDLARYYEDSGHLEPAICSELLIQEDIGSYNYRETRYDGVPIFSEDGEEIGTAKCCGAHYQTDVVTSKIAFVCLYDNRKDTENSIRWLAKEDGWSSGEYMGQKVYLVKSEGEAMFWINNNYIIAAINEGDGEMPEAIAEAYLRKHPSDLGVLEPVPCGIGGCIPEEEEEPEEIPEDNAFYRCNGCELEGKCYPVGYRKEGEYCGMDNSFVGQIGKGTCDNNFECKSNVCVSSECIEEGLLKKIINWFKKLFGAE